MQEAAGVALVLETDDEVVGVAHDDHVARGLTLSPAHGPQNVPPCGGLRTVRCQAAIKELEMLAHSR